ncbi:hypothetical protein ACYX8G_18495 [Microbacterium saperdae]
MSDPQFELKKITDTEWVILDHRYGPTDARRTVACVYQLDECEVEVVWLRDLPLTTSYTSPIDVLEDVSRLHLPRRAQRPRPIRHLPPLASTA